MEKRTPETQTRSQPLPLRVHSRVRVVAITIRAWSSQSLRNKLLEHLAATGTVTSFDPRYTLPYRVKFDDGSFLSFAEKSLQVLEP